MASCLAAAQPGLLSGRSSHATHPHGLRPLPLPLAIVQVARSDLAAEITTSAHCQPNPNDKASLRMRKHIQTSSVILAGLFSTALIASQARAQKTPAPPADDIRCLIVAMQFAASTEADQKTGGDILAMYYMGRLEKYSASVIEDAITKQLPSLNAELFKTEAARCGKALMEKGQILTLIGTNLTQRAKQQQTPAPH
jgi:hypothetical protein